jgi:RHS repeat-associated protein
LSASQTWDCNGGVLTSTTDANGEPANYGYVNQSGTADPFWRVLSATDPLSNTTWTTYSPGFSTTPAETALNFPASNPTSTVDVLNTLDGLGRALTTKDRTAPGATTFDQTVQYTYGWTSTGAVTGPFTTQTVPGGSALTTTQLDALGRTATVTDGGGGLVSYQYINNDVLQTLGPAPSGENTKQRQLEFDGLGRITSVCEITSAPGSGAGACGQSNPKTGLLTKYTYDALGNLLTVTQNAQPGAIGGTQTRTYGPYDGLSRLTSEANPESGTTTYTYDTDATCGTSKGDLVKRIDANGNTVCNTYDALHRTTSTTFSGPNGTTNRYFVYDAATVDGQAMANAKGRLAEGYTASSSSGTKVTDEGFSYTARGELTNFYESTPHSAGYYSVPITYWANGLVETFGPFLTYGSLGYNPDGEGRPYSLQSTDYLQSTTYNAASQPTQLKTPCTSGTNCYPISYEYDPNTLRMTQYSWALSGGTVSGTLNWNPNGSLQKLVIADPFNSADAQTCTYSADDLSRIASVSCGSTWAQTFTYDAFGNLTKNGSISWIPGYNASTNHYALAGTSYDANGNVLKDSLNTYTWDAAGKNLSTLYGNNGQTWAFTYDAFGHKVEWLANGNYELSYVTLGNYKLSASGQTANYSLYPLPRGSVLSFGGGWQAVQMADWLGTIRAVASDPGNDIQTGAHAPFGEEYSFTAQYPRPSIFTGQEDDGNANPTIYYFQERPYPSSQGRWLSPDPAGSSSVDPTNPQSWNRYAYVLNNPLSNVDPDGLDCVYLNDAGNGVFSIDHNSNPEECSGPDANGNPNGGYWVPGTVANSSWVTNIDQNNNQIGAYSQFDNGTLGWTGSTNQEGGGWGTVGIDVATTPIPLTYDQAAMVAIANVFNNSFPTACTYSLSARASVAGFGFGINDTQSGTSMSWGPTATLSNNLRITVGMSSKGVGAPDPASTIRIGPAAGGLALNPTNGQIGAYAGKSFKIAGKDTGVTLTATVGKIGTNNSCANVKPK